MTGRGPRVAAFLAPAALLPMAAALLAALVAGSGCAVPSYDGSTLAGKKAIIDSVNIALSREDCATAIAAIEPLYASASSDNSVRYARASAQACAAGMTNFMTVLGEVGSKGSQMLGGGLWTTTTEIFYASDSDTLDKRIAAAFNSMDALFAILQPGIVVASGQRIFTDTPNVGSVISTDRERNSNLYLVFVAMAAMGAAQSRHGAADASFQRTKILGDEGDTFGWTRASNVDEEACGYAAAVVNLIDAISDASQVLRPGPTRSSLEKIVNGDPDIGFIGYSALLDNVCNAGCRAENYESFLGAGATAYATGCTFNTAGDQGCRGSSGRPCLPQLRNREFCATNDSTSLLDDRARCAAAGIANFVSRDTAYKWPGSP